MIATPGPDGAARATGEERRTLLEGLRSASNLADLEHTSFFKARRGEVETLLGTPEIVRRPGAAPRRDSFVRVVQWNIEKGREFDRTLRLLSDDPVLAGADILLLNEADHGMARSGNRHVARDLADALAMHVVYAPAHLELTKGTGDDLTAAGENTASLQGNAILSRHDVLEARVVGLPTVFEPYHFHERRYGRRNCVWARLRVADRDWWVGSTHLEVRNTPRARRRQVEHLLERLPGTAAEPHLVGGDLNTNGFSRGTLWRTLRSAARLVARPAARVKAELVRPDLGSEPLFELFARAGFGWQSLNGNEATAVTLLDALEDADLLPAWLRAAIRARLAPYDEVLEMKLDWLIGRGVRPRAAGSERQGGSGAGRAEAGCIPIPWQGADRVSDHRPIFADLALQ